MLADRALLKLLEGRAGKLTGGVRFDRVRECPCNT